MSTAPVSVTPQLLADVLDALGRRPRARLDADPQLGADWPQQSSADGWQVTAGELAVLTLAAPSGGALTALSQLHCSCLVDGPCVHLAAYLRRLPVRGSDDAGTEPVPMSDDGAARPDLGSAPATVAVTSTARDAAELGWTALGSVLAAGARRCGVLESAQLLRAAQACRAARLYRLEGALLGVTDSVSRLARSEPTFTLDGLTEQLLEAAQCSHQLRSATEADVAWFGSAQRTFTAAAPQLLHGAGAEPVDRGSGDPALRVHLWGRSGWSHLQARPVPAAELVGGYQVSLGADGSLPRPADLSRRQAQVVGAGRSDDGRLGGGSTLRVALRESGSVGSPGFDALWDQPLTEQVAAVLATGGLVACAGTVRGATPDGLVVDTETGPVLLPRPPGGGRGRTNLAVLASVAGLRLRILGRPDRRRPRVLWPVAVAGGRDESRWQLPPEWHELANVSFDDVRASYLGLAAVAPVGVEVELPVELCAGLEPLERRVSRVVLGGRIALTVGSRGAADVALLRRRGLNGAADALTELATSPTEASGLLTRWLAAATYASVAHEQLLISSW